MRNCPDLDIFREYQKAMRTSKQSLIERAENKYLDSLFN
jgi:hypothetical protein